jgi:hypothetical protein
MEFLSATISAISGYDVLSFQSGYSGTSGKSEIFFCPKSGKKRNT